MYIYIYIYFLKSTPLDFFNMYLQEIKNREKKKEHRKKKKPYHSDSFTLQVDKRIEEIETREREKMFTPLIHMS